MKAPGPRPKARLVNIQILRGVAAIAVVCAHSIDKTIAYAPDNVFTEAGHVDNVGAIGVDIFFIISGFVMTYSVVDKSGGRAAKDFLILRWIRIAPPYLIATAATLLIMALAGHAPNWRSLLTAVTLVPVFDTSEFTPPPIYVGWTLSFEFTFYLYITIIVALSKTRYIWGLGVLFLATGIINSVVPSNAYFLISWVTNPIFIEFGLGIAAYYLWRTILKNNRKLFIFLGLIGVGTIFMQVVIGYGEISESQFTLDGTLSFMRVLLWGLPCFLVFCGVLALPEWEKGPMASAAQKLGDASYSVYLIHPIILTVALFLLKRVPIALPGLVVFIVVGACGIAVGILYYELVEHPLTRLLKLKYQTRNSRIAHKTTKDASRRFKG